MLAVVFAAESQPLQHANEEKGDGRKPPGGLKCWEEADERRCAAHDRQRHQECVFAADDVADTSEKERTKGTDQEADANVER
jgi:hypothetical protein